MLYVTVIIIMSNTLYQTKHLLRFTKKKGGGGVAVALLFLVLFTNPVCIVDRFWFRFNLKTKLGTDTNKDFRNVEKTAAFKHQ
jgi:hypothetical protein